MDEGGARWFQPARRLRRMGPSKRRTEGRPAGSAPKAGNLVQNRRDADDLRPIAAPDRAALVAFGMGPGLMAVALEIALRAFLDMP